MILSVPLFLGGLFAGPFLFFTVVQAAGIISNTLFALCLALTLAPGFLLVRAGARLAGRTAAILPGGAVLAGAGAMYILGLTDDKMKLGPFLLLLGVFGGVLGVGLIVYGVTKPEQWQVGDK
jgi:hypothetical protein